MMKWERLNDSGFTTANKIVNMKISEQLQDNKLEITCDNSTTESEKPSPKYNEELDNCCTELLETLKKMTKIQLKMEKLSSTTKGICDLEKFHHGGGSCAAPLFHTWPTAYFFAIEQKIAAKSSLQRFFEIQLIVTPEPSNAVIRQTVQKSSKKELLTAIKVSGRLTELCFAWYLHYLLCEVMTIITS
ncbi:cyclin-dependent kinase 2-interacting protein isoform X2 [Gallus gallus]|nr:cyclin-dependent kinase 2-interacting protein isoform X2 [Gallus gallus]XP_046774658.1 cyclin-dependent kinase 2-interacting protein isoform X2 [Gallus gallus]|eukprot:XP_015142963.1 cyclin-dependent kinase 2-interacting protein isoform X2 [Gallus gallus]